MTLHTPTIVVLSLLTDLLLVLILLHAWRTRTTYPGFLYWVVGTACWAFGSLITFMFTNLQPVFIPRIIGTGLMLLHPVLLYEGLRRFYDFPQRLSGTPLNFALVSATLLNSLYFIYVHDDFALRSAPLSVAIAFIFSRIAIEPLLQRTSRAYSMQWLMSCSIIPMILLLFARAVSLLAQRGSPATLSTAMQDDGLLRMTMLYTLVVELMIAYSYLSLTSDRVERELQAAHRAAEAANRTKESFLKMVSHELRTPLATITGIADLLTLRGATNDELPRMLQRAALHQQRLINDLLDSAAMETGNISIIHHPFNLLQLLDEFRDTYLPRTRARGISYQGIRSNDLPEMIMGDRQRIFQVCANLFENALKYTPPGGSIIARAELMKDQTAPLLCFSATDTGCGIPVEQQEAIFAPFVSLEPEKAGLGLGLAICRQLTAAMGGQLTCESSPGHGSTFRFIIPCQLPPPDWSESDVHKDLSINLQQPLQVMAVDDTLENLQLLELLLQGTPASISPFTSARQALEQLESSHFDLLLTDIRMPDMDGFDLVKTVRSREQRLGQSPMRIVAVSANAYPEDISAALGAGCDSYLSRPFTLQALLHELSLVVPAAASAQQTLSEEQDDPFRQLQERAQQRISASRALIEAALASNDIAVIREEGHRIKGLGMTFGLPEVERIGGMLEHAAIKGRLEGVPELLEELKP